MIRIPDELFERDRGGHLDTPPDFASELAAAREAAMLTRAGAAASRALHDLDRSFDESKDDPTTWADRFEADARGVREEQIARLSASHLGDAFARDFDDLAAAKLATVRRLAAGRELDQARAELEATLDSYAVMCAEASSDIEARIVEGQAVDSIARMAEAGYLRDGQDEELRRAFAERREKAQLDRLIDEDPDAAVNALADPSRFPVLVPEMRMRLKDRAQIRAEDRQREADAARWSEHQGMLAGLMLRLEGGEADRADIMQAEADGWLGQAERERALSLWDDRRHEARRREDDIDRVNAALRGDGATLDRDNPDDVVAVDTHFEDAKAAWLAAGIQESQLVPLIVDYVRTTGILPSSVRREISGAFRGGDPKAIVRALELMAQLPSSALATIDQRDGAEGLLGLALERTGWSPEQAVDRAARIMAGTIEPNDRFIEQDRAAITALIERASAGNVQLASLPLGTGSAGTTPEITTDALPPHSENIQVAALPIVLGVMFGGLALASIMAIKIGSDGTRDAWDKWNRSDEDYGSAQTLPPPRPLRSQEQMPAQPNDLPNIPPPVPSANEQLVPEIIEIHTLPGPPPEPAVPVIYIFTPPDFELPTYLENRKGGFRSKAEIDYHRDRILDANPGWTHVAGGRNRKTGKEMNEYWHSGPGYGLGDGRMGGHFADLTFRDEKGELVHIQHASVDRNGKPTAKELDNARALAQPHYVNGKLERPRVYIVLKQWQMRK